MYENGKGVPKDMVSAINFYRSAAQKNFAPSQFNLGIYYTEGEAIKADYTKAYVWMAAAAKSNQPNAQSSLDEIAKQMTPTQMADAKAKLSECLAHEFKGCD